MTETVAAPERFPRWIPVQPLTEFEVHKFDYSSGPWRIIHIPTGKWVAWEAAVVHVHGADQLLDVCGYRTKADAQDALWRMAAATVEHLRLKLADVVNTEAQAS